MNSQVQWLTLFDPETGQREIIGASNHPFWVERTTPEHPLAPIVKVSGNHLHEQTHYCLTLDDIADATIAPADLRPGVLIANHGARRVLDLSRTNELAVALETGARCEPALLATRGWVYSQDLKPGYVLRAIDGRLAVVETVRVEHVRRRVYNLAIPGAPTFAVSSGAWVHNNIRKGQCPGPPLTQDAQGRWHDQSGLYTHAPEPYNRGSHYGRTPTAADRRAAGVGPDEVLDHEPPLVQRYYEGDPVRAEPPGYSMTQAERKASGSDRTRMHPQPRSESNAQGAEMRQYSLEMRKKLGLN